MLLADAALDRETDTAPVEPADAGLVLCRTESTRPDRLGRLLEPELRRLLAAWKPGRDELKLVVTAAGAPRRLLQEGTLRRRRWGDTTACFGLMSAMSLLMDETSTRGLRAAALCAGLAIYVDLLENSRIFDERSIALKAAPGRRGAPQRLRRSDVDEFLALALEQSMPPRVRELLLAVRNGFWRANEHAPAGDFKKEDDALLFVGRALDSIPSKATMLIFDDTRPANGHGNTRKVMLISVEGASSEHWIAKAQVDAAVKLLIERDATKAEKEKHDGSLSKLRDRLAKLGFALDALQVVRA